VCVSEKERVRESVSVIEERRARVRECVCPWRTKDRVGMCVFVRAYHKEWNSCREWTQATEGVK